MAAGSGWSSTASTIRPTSGSNGHQVGGLTYLFARSAHDVTEWIAEKGENALAVKITPMPVPGSPGQGSRRGVLGGRGRGSDEPQLAHVSGRFGVDWTPAAGAGPGLGDLDHVRLRSTGPVVIGDPRVDTVLPDLPDTSVAELTLTVPVRNADAVEHTTTVSASFGDVRVTKAVTVPQAAERRRHLRPGRLQPVAAAQPRTVVAQRARQPRRRTTMPTLAASVRTESDRRTTRFGIRQFGYEYDVPLPFTSSGDACTQSLEVGRQQARYVRVRCLTRATDWGNSLWTLSVTDSGRPGTTSLCTRAPPPPRR